MGRRASLLIVVAAIVVALGLVARSASGVALKRSAPATRPAAGTRVLAAGASAHKAASAGDSPRGFWYGTDTARTDVTGSGPYLEPVIGGYYGGYMGMAGSWARLLRCQGAFPVWSTGNSARADRNFTRYHKGVGTGAYWFMGGPGVDPHYDGTTAEARKWGARQAARALANIRALPSSQRVLYPVLWLDVELPGIAPAPDNGWKSVYTSPCSGRVKRNPVRPAVDRADFDGFWDHIRAHSAYTPGVYSAPGAWKHIFGMGSASLIPNADEWTYEPETADLSNAPRGWCYRESSGCAKFFGGVTRSSKHALMWQFSGGGGVRNGYGDFDQIDRRALK